MNCTRNPVLWLVAAMIAVGELAVTAAQFDTITDADSYAVFAAALELQDGRPASPIALLQETRATTHCTDHRPVPPE